MKTLAFLGAKCAHRLCGASVDDLAHRTKVSGLNTDWSWKDVSLEMLQILCNIFSKSHKILNVNFSKEMSTARIVFIIQTIY